MSAGSVSDRALVKMLANANKMDSADFKNLGQRTLTRIAAQARAPGAKQGSKKAAGAFDGQALAARATKVLKARAKNK